VEEAFVLLNSALRLSTPLLFAALAGLISERAGVLDIGLEGKMLLGAFASASAAYVSGNAWVGLLSGVAAAVALGLLHGYACIRHRGNQVVSGIALIFLASGLTGVLAESWFRQGGRTPTLAAEARFLPVSLPMADAIADIPLLGPVYSELISKHTFLDYLSLASFAVVVWVFKSTRFGLRLRAVGEHPLAAETTGVKVPSVRYVAVAWSGAFCGLAGATLSMAQAASFLKDMSAGKGFIAIAALIFARWRPGRVLGTCLLFGFLDATAIRLQGERLVVGKLPNELVLAFPYIATVLLLAFHGGRARAPAALGQPYLPRK